MKASKTEVYPPNRKGNLTSQKSNLRPDPEPEVYFIDETRYQDYCKIYSEALESFQKIASGYNTIGLDVLTADIMRKISNNDFSEIEKKVYSNIEESLKKTGVTNKIVLSNLRKDTDEPYLRFKIRADLDLLHIGYIRNTHPGIEISSDIYSINNGVVAFDDEARARLKEKYCVIRIDSQAKRDFLQQTEKTLENLQVLKSILCKNGINSLFGENNLFSETDQVILNKEILGYIK